MSSFAFLFQPKGVKIRECPDATLRLDLIPMRIAEIRREPWSKKNQGRINALLTRQGFPPEKDPSAPKQTRQEKKAIAKAFVPTLKRFELDGAVELATPEGLIPNNVWAGLVVQQSDEKRGYKFKGPMDGSLESAMARLGLKTA